MADALACDVLEGVAVDDLRDRLRRLQRSIDRLTGARTRIAGELERRALASAGPGREAQALRQVRQETVRTSRLSPSQVKRDGEVGRAVAERPEQAAALRDGDLSPEHARVLADVLRGLDPTTRDALERELLVAARTQDPITFGRTCRRRLAELDARAAVSAQRRRQARRSLRVTETPDGMLALHGEGAGLEAEVVATALHAFRRPDAAGERRRADQATWDALVAVCRTALDAGTAPRDRGVRPHVTVTVRHEDVVAAPIAADGRPGERGQASVAGGVAETTFLGPLPYHELRRLLADAGVARLLVDARGLPLEASEEVRTVPAALWRALLVRDRVCIGDGCDVPAGWCQVMHLDVPYRLAGRLSPGTAALGCSFHHRMLDHHGWSVRWRDGRPVLVPPTGSDPPRDDPPDPGG